MSTKDDLSNGDRKQDNKGKNTVLGIKHHRLMVCLQNIFVVRTSMDLQSNQDYIQLERWNDTKYIIPAIMLLFWILGKWVYPKWYYDEENNASAPIKVSIVNGLVTCAVLYLTKQTCETEVRILSGVSPF